MMYIGLDVYKRVCYGTLTDEEGNIIRRGRFSKEDAARRTLKRSSGEGKEIKRRWSKGRFEGVNQHRRLASFLSLFCRHNRPLLEETTPSLDSEPFKYLLPFCSVHKTKRRRGT